LCVELHFGDLVGAVRITHVLRVMHDIRSLALICVLCKLRGASSVNAELTGAGTVDLVKSWEE
jgi:hypothetical protein